MVNLNFSNISLLILLPLATSAPQTQAPKISKHPVLLVVSLDGFRADYLTAENAPNLKTLQDEGIKVPYMKAQFPTKTFPNHQSIVTGLYPDFHGITDNTLYDPIHDKVLSGFNDDPEFWNFHEDVLPFYIRNEQAGDGRYSGCYLWAGSSTPNGYGSSNSPLYPKYYIPKYDESIPWDNRVKTVISWITHATNPANIVFLYHDEPDSKGHQFGTDDPETIKEIQATDERIGYLVQSLKDAGIYDRINLIVLSDHGMQSVKQQDVINITDVVDNTLYTNRGSTPVYQIQPNNTSDLNRIYEDFKNASEGKNFTAYKKGELSHFNYGSNRRVMDIILLADPGYGFQDLRRFSENGVAGVHGYDNNAASMRALFVARGPNFKKSFESNPINNIDLVALFGELMGVGGIPHNGSLDDIKHILDNVRGNEDGDSGAIWPSISTHLILLVQLFLWNSKNKIL